MVTTNGTADPHARDLDTEIRAILGRALAAIDILPANLLWSGVGIARTTGNLQIAHLILDAVELRKGRSATLLDERARLAYAAGDTDESLKLLSERAAGWPSPTASCAVARLMLETGNVEGVKPFVDELIAAHGDLASVKQLAVDVAIARGESELARSFLLALVDDRPEHPASLLTLAKLALSDSDRDAATAFFQRALAGDEQLTAHQLSNAAEIAESLNLYEQATDLKDRASALHAARTRSLLEAIERALPNDAQAIVDVPLEQTAPLTTIAVRSSAQQPRPAREHRGAIHAVDPSELDDPQVLEALRTRFGHEQLRPGQEAVISHVRSGLDTLAIMPTGVGKSLTFQLPALIDEGTTVVVSPLIALMKDQVESLPSSVQEVTTLVNSSVSFDELRRRLDRVARGEVKLVYVAPERLRNYGFLRALREAKVSRVVVDEAHCISLWGHDFRPDYLFIPRALTELGDPPILAITATATPEMVDQIAQGLGRDLTVVRTSVFRPNLTYEVHRLERKEAKLERVVEICRAESGDGIVYVSSRRDAESIATLLRDRGVFALPYHAGLDPAVRSANQDSFMSGNARVVVATVAFGMGVNKADVRFIVHISPPRSLEAYAQESGRAGRDGKPARCILLVTPHDRNQLVAAARRDEIDLATLRRHYRSLQQRAAGRWVIFDPAQLRSFGPDDNSEPDPRVAFGILEQAGLIRRHPDAPVSYELRRTARPLEGLIDDALLSNWQVIEASLPATWSQRGFCSISTAEQAAGTGLSPIEIDRVFQAHSEVSVREGQRCMCLHLKEVETDAGATLIEILERTRQSDQRRINQVMAYANGRTCRHATLAAHLGERLEACGTACDVCLGLVETQPPKAVKPSASSAIRAEDALAVLQCVRTLPYPMGKLGLIRLLSGSIESRLRADRSASFGALSHLSKGKVDGLIDRLIEAGFLHRDLEHEFRLISLTEMGVSATIADLESMAERVATVQQMNGDSDLGPADNRLYERLTAWRKAKAIEESLPPYVVAHNSTLRNIAVARPQSRTALLAVPGFGPKGVEKYGAELLALVAETAIQG